MRMSKQDLNRELTTVKKAQEKKTRERAKEDEEQKKKTRLLPRPWLSSASHTRNAAQLFRQIGKFLIMGRLQRPPMSVPSSQHCSRTARTPFPSQ